VIRCDDPFMTGNQIQSKERDRLVSKLPSLPGRNTRADSPKGPSALNSIGTLTTI